MEIEWSEGNPVWQWERREILTTFVVEDFGVNLQCSITATEMNDSWAWGFLGLPERSSAWPWFETMLPWPQTPFQLKCCHSAQGIFKGHFVVCLQWHIKLSSCLWVNKMLHKLYDESMQLNKPLQGEESHDYPAGYWEDVREDESQSRELQGEGTAQWGVLRWCKRLWVLCGQWVRLLKDVKGFWTSEKRALKPKHMRSWKDFDIFKKINCPKREWYCKNTGCSLDTN